MASKTTLRRTKTRAKTRTLPRVSRAKTAAAKTPKSTPSVAEIEAKTAAESSAAENDSVHRTIGKGLEYLHEATNLIIEGWAGRDAESAADSLIDALYFIELARNQLVAVERRIPGVTP